MKNLAELTQAEKHLEACRWQFALLQMRAEPEGAAILHRAFVYLCNSEYYIAVNKQWPLPGSPADD